MSLIGRFFRKLSPKGELKWAKKNGMITGNNVTVMSGVSFGSEPYLIKIGSNVRISSNVCFVNHDGGTFVFRDQEKYKNVIKYGRITIGDHVFIGNGSIIMPGVEIGDYCVVGAGSVVTKNVPSNSVVCGVPAKMISTTSDYAEKCLKNTPNYDIDEYKKNKKEYLMRIIW